MVDIQIKRIQRSQSIGKNMKFLKALVLHFVCWFGAALAGPLDLITERAWIQDPTGQMTLEQVRRAPEQTLTTTHFNEGFSTSTFWIRLRIDPSRIAPDERDDRLIMRIWPPYLDEIALFDPLYQGTVPQITGDRHELLASEYRSLNLNFVLPKGQEARDVWVRLKTISSTLMDIQVLTETQAKALDWQQTIAVIVYIVILVACLGWASMAWLMLRDRLILFYMARELTAIVFAIVLLGVLRALDLAWLSPSWIDGATNFMGVWTVAVVIWFDIHFLSQYRPSPLAIRILRTVVALAAFGAVMTVLGFSPWVLQFNFWLTTLMSVGVMLVALSTRAWSDASAEDPPEFPRWLLVGSYMVMPMSILVNRAVHIGWLPPMMQATHAPFVYLLFGSVTMMVMLQIRAFRTYQRQQEVHMNLRLAEKLAKEERERREQQEQFLAMLGHELRNPLAAVGMLADQSTEEGQQIRRAVTDMNQVLERSVQTNRLTDARFKPEMAVINLHVLISEICQRSHRIDLDNFAPDMLVQSDRMYLHIALGNLLDNALKYSPVDSPVQVTCTQEPHNGTPILRVRVSNTPGSAGWPDPEQLFQKYYRSPLSHHQVGSGLGLYLAQSLLKMIGAKITYLPPSEGGAQLVVFELCMPQASHKSDSITPSG